jgi:hypothetical protein
LNFLERKKQLTLQGKQKRLPLVKRGQPEIPTQPIKELQMLVPKEELRLQARELVVQPIKELQMLVPKEELRQQVRDLVACR